MSELNWGILLAGYLFVGGLSGGAYIVGALADLLRREKNYKVLSKSGIYVSLPMIIVGLVLLILDLGRFDVDPLSPLNAYINFPTSIMSVGTWIITAFTAVSLATAVLWFFRGSDLIRKILQMAGLVLAGSTVAYTGLLLAFARGRPLWSSPFLPWTFIVSGILTGLAMGLILIPVIAIFIPRFFEDFKELFNMRAQLAGLYVESQRYVAVLIIVEIALVLIELVSGYPHSGVLTTGSGISMFFYLYVLLGLVLPLAIAYYSERTEIRGNEDTSILISLASFVLILIGGFLLRYAILTAGQIV